MLFRFSTHPWPCEVDLLSEFAEFALRSSAEHVPGERQSLPRVLVHPRLVGVVAEIAPNLDVAADPPPILTKGSMTTAPL